ncbi:MAG: IS66 family insertion sequence element accessory protein TnpB [Blastocatellia bacterium]|nr:IS66 family insertion sequence element accessory protein TnpB [Blastocatellia bacterium]
MRKSFNGLCGIVQAEFARDIRDGDLFLFLNRRGDRIKAMYWDRDGIAIWMKRLEQGTFQRPLANAASVGINQVEIDATDLSLLLSGIDLKSAKRRQRYVAGASQQSQSRIAETV